MLYNWIENKHLLPCKYCGDVSIYTRFSDMKIKRFGIHCVKCGRHIAWAPDIYLEECKELEIKL